MHRSRILSAAALLAACCAGCGESEPAADPSDPHAAGSSLPPPEDAVPPPSGAGWSAHGMLLLPDGPRARVGRDFRLTFRGNGALDGALVRELTDAFDPCMARVGGHQLNMLAPGVVDGRAGLHVRLPVDGHAMVGFSTRPREIATAGRRVRFSQHVKSLFLAAHTAGGVPETSAAMSYRFGLELEIVPMLDPLALLPDDQLPLQVRFDGPELPGAELAFSWLPDGAGAAVRELFRGRTDAVGMAVVRVRGPGRYVATVGHESAGHVRWAALTFLRGER